jgi:Ca2+-binding EF-hand superfamily protein
MGDPLTEAELISIVSIADVDGDGRISAAEFATLAETLHQIASLKAELGV